LPLDGKHSAVAHSFAKQSPAERDDARPLAMAGKPSTIAHDLLDVLP
jgi:hypothetical protein